MNDQNDKAIESIYMTLAFGHDWKEILEKQHPDVQKRMKECAAAEWIKSKVRVMTITSLIIFFAPIMLILTAYTHA